MDNTLADVKIFKIHVGPDPLTGMDYSVGQKVYAGKGKNRVESVITSIVRSETQYHLFGNITYIMYAERTDTKKQFVHRYFENMPVMVIGVTPDSRMERVVDLQFSNNENTTEHVFNPSR